MNMIALRLCFLYAGIPILYDTNRKISEHCQSPLILLKCIVCKNIFVHLFMSKPRNLM